MATVTERMSVAAESLSLEAVRSLMQPQGDPCLSLYLPTHRNVPNNSVDLPTFRQLVGGLETGLAAAHPRHEIERLLEGTIWRDATSTVLGRLDPATGAIRPSPHVAAVPSPVCIVFLPSGGGR